MSKSANKEYKLISEVTIEQLKENNFKYVDGYYSYKFPVYKNKKETLLWGFLNINFEEKKCFINVVDSNNNTYPAYHNREYGENKIIELVDKKINEQINILIKNKIIKKKQI